MGGWKGMADWEGKGDQKGMADWKGMGDWKGKGDWNGKDGCLLFAMSCGKPYHVRTISQFSKTPRFINYSD